LAAAPRMLLRDERAEFFSTGAAVGPERAALRPARPRHGRLPLPSGAWCPTPRTASATDGRPDARLERTGSAGDLRWSVMRSVESAMTQPSSVGWK
jgi:hypothetical protein